MSDGAWKGLDRQRAPVFLDYNRVETLLAALLGAAESFRPEAVAAVQRGGVIPGSMAAGILALPLAFVSYDRATAAARWLGPRPDVERLLVVDDGCSTGATLDGVRRAAEADGFRCLTLAVVHDPEVARHVPDLSHAMTRLWRFPWERGEATPAARALRAGASWSDREAEAPVQALDLDGIFLPDLGPQGYASDLDATLARRDGLSPFSTLPPFDAARTVVVSGRPAADFARTRAWLDRWGHAALPLLLRPEGVSDDPRAVAVAKARLATVYGCTHFVESDPAQAIAIAAAAPHLIVSWWDAATRRAHTVAAAAHPEGPAPATTGRSSSTP